MHILGLDFGSETGVAYGDAGAPAQRVQTETWKLPTGGAEDVGPFMHALRNLLDDRLMRGVALVVFEAPFRPSSFVGTDQLRRAYGASALVEEVAYGRQIKCIEVVTSTLKLEFASYGRADKPEMIQAARKRGFTVANHHEADAAACWLHGVLHFAPTHLAALYDPISRGQLS